MPDITAEQIIAHLNLRPLPIEGGYYAVTYRSDETLPAASLPERYDNARPLAGAIYFLMTTAQFSALHSLPTDEVYYYHLGDPVEMLLLHPDGTGTVRILGADICAGQQLQTLAPRQCWHGARPRPGARHGFSLCSTSMAPAYATGDAVFAEREGLIAQYPPFGTLITALTRPAA